MVACAYSDFTFTAGSAYCINPGLGAGPVYLLYFLMKELRYLFIKTKYSVSRSVNLNFGFVIPGFYYFAG